MYHHLVLVPVITFVIIVYLSAFKDGKPTCDRYILNTYLYSFTYLFLLMYFVLLAGKYPDILGKLDMMRVFGVVFLNMGLFLTIVLLPAEQYELKHVLSILFVAASSLLLNWTFMFYGSKTVLSAVIMTIVLFTILTIIAFRFQDLISSKVTLVFVIVFILLVIAQTIIGMLYPSSLFEKIIVTVVLMLVCFLVLVKTKAMIEHKEKCKAPDYVKESLGFIISFENILVQILHLKKNR